MLRALLGPFSTPLLKYHESKGSSMADAINFAEPHLTRIFHCWVCFYSYIIYLVVSLWMAFILCTQSLTELHILSEGLGHYSGGSQSHLPDMISASNCPLLCAFNCPPPMCIQTVPPPMCIQFAFGQTSAIVVGIQRCIYAPLPGHICQGFVVDEITERVGRSDKSKFWIGSYLPGPCPVVHQKQLHCT